jgi:hypothetical protein
MPRRVTTMSVLLAAVLAGCSAPKPTSGTLSRTAGVFLGWEDLDSRPLLRLTDSRGIEFQLHVPDDAEIVIDGNHSKREDLKKGMDVDLVNLNHTVIRVEARSGR